MVVSTTSTTPSGEAAAKRARVSAWMARSERFMVVPVWWWRGFRSGGGGDSFPLPCSLLLYGTMWGGGEMDTQKKGEGERHGHSARGSEGRSLEHARGAAP